LFFTLYACSGTLGINAWNHAWKNRAPLGKSTLLWVFPPFYLIGDMLQKLLEVRVNAILLLPKGVKTWTLKTLLFKKLPVLEILETYSLSGRKGMFSLGAQAAPSRSQVMDRTHMNTNLIVSH